MFDFSERVAIVTGAAGTLGQAVARAFHAAGARTVLADRDGARLQEIYPVCRARAATSWRGAST